MMKKFTILLAFCLITSGLLHSQTTAPASFGPTPNSRQMKYLKSPMAAFIHFGMNTFAGSDGIEWGNDIKRDPSVFNSTNGKVDTDQWVRLLKKAGFTRVIITLKHHDGFCTWPTKITNYNISKSPYLNGQGDLAKELSESCDKYGMDMGIYLSPWDAWEPSYDDSTPGDYNDFYDGQLRELLGGNYGRMNPETGKREIAEIWLDGATGSGAAYQTYDFNRFVSTARELQPNCLTWMTLGTAANYTGAPENFPVDAFWVGNERGYVNDPVWMKVLVNGSSVSQYNLNGQYMCIPEADVSIRPGWFYHSSQDGSVKSFDQLVDDIYFRSVGLGIPLLLNVPPNKVGKFHNNDSVALMKFGTALQETFKTNLITSSMTATSSAVRGAGFEASKAIDGDYDTYWTMADGQTTGSITVDLGQNTELDVIRLQEYLPLGQRVSGFKVEVEVYGTWKEFGSGQTIGFQRMIKGQLVTARKIRLTITDSQAVPLINSIEAYHTHSSITDTGAVPSGINNLNADQMQTVAPQKISKLKFEVTGIPASHWPTLAEMRFYKRVNGERVEIDRAGFTATATSEAKQAVNGQPDCLASNTLDNNYSTIWQPVWQPKVSMPQSLMYNFGKEIECSEIRYLPRQTSAQDIATSFRIYIAPTAADAYTLSLTAGTFSATVQDAQFTPVKNSDWTLLRSYGKFGSAIQSKVSGATVVFNVNGSFFRLYGTKSPSSGIMEVRVDGVMEAVVDLYASTISKDELLLEKNSLPAGNHSVEIKVTGTKNANATDALVTIQNVISSASGLYGVFELSNDSITLNEGIGMYTFEVRRSGNLNLPAQVTFNTTPGTGVQGKVYTDMAVPLHFAAGEAVKTAQVEILENDNREGDKDFYIELTNPSENYILGINKSTRVLVIDNETDHSLDAYCVPAGTQHSRMKNIYRAVNQPG